MTIKKKNSKEKSTKKKAALSTKEAKTKTVKKRAPKPAAKRARPARPKLVSKTKLKIKPKTKKAVELKPKSSLGPSPLAPPRQPPETVLPKEVPEPKGPKVIAEPEEKDFKSLELDFPITVKDLAVKLQIKPSFLIKKLMDKKLMLGINQAIEEQLAVEISKDFGFKIKKALGLEEAILDIHQKKDSPKSLKLRPPVVTLMGHVDHGKTSLLDRIRKARVAESEHGGITQHIGAYQVAVNSGTQATDEKKIVFLDTPGHEAFTMMRARGAQVTDIVVLVVAADDGVMPQTIEAIDHAKEAKVPIIVAINKIDKAADNLDKVKKQLAKYDLVPEDWQGKTITVAVSAKTGEGIDELLEMILLESDMLELKANYERLASGIVIEAKLSKGKGPLATFLIQNGTLRINDNFIVGKFNGKVKAMLDDYGRMLKEAGPSAAVEVLGLEGVPEAGEQFYVVEEEKEAKEIAYQRQEKEKQHRLRPAKKVSLEHLHAQIKEGAVKELKIILKADVMGSLEAIKESLKKLEIEEISLNVIHCGTGDINSSDVILASASNALILGFNVVADSAAKELMAKEDVESRIYNVIYELNNDIKAAVEGMLEPKIKKVFLGRAQVRKVFRLSRAGLVAGCYVTKGKILRSSEVSIIRNGKPVFDGKISSLKRFKDDVREVAEGFECGITLANAEDILEGDYIEAYEIQKIARKL